MTIFKRLLGRPSPEVVCPECGAKFGAHEQWCPKR